MYKLHREQKRKAKLNKRVKHGYGKSSRMFRGINKSITKIIKDKIKVVIK